MPTDSLAQVCSSLRIYRPPLPAGHMLHVCGVPDREDCVQLCVVAAVGHMAFGARIMQSFCNTMHCLTSTGCLYDIAATLHISANLAHIR
jgi:hypothetical protein